MDIASLSIGMSQISQQNSAQLAVVNMAMDTSEVESTNMMKMLSTCVEQDKGQNIDVTV